MPVVSEGSGNGSGGPKVVGQMKLFLVLVGLLEIVSAYLLCIIFLQKDDVL